LSTWLRGSRAAHMSSGRLDESNATPASWPTSPFTTQSAGNRDAADRVIAHLDRQAAFSRADLTIKHRGIEGILVGYPLGEALRLMQSSD